MSDVQGENEASPVRELSRPQRRALGVLVEKAFTVPESYPMTLKALTAGANQKSNRSPISNYSEDQMWQALDELRQLGLVGMVETESGRTERFRHYMRKRFPFSEPQLAIITELLLRGRQQLGELRTRASRMVRIDTQEDLKQELQGLLQRGFLQADGDLDRRGVEVDHNFYLPGEGMTLERCDSDDIPADEDSSRRSTAEPTGNRGGNAAGMAVLRDEIEQLQARLNETNRIVSELQDELRELKRSLGA